MLITDTAVRETAATLTQNLGPGWTLDPEAPADGAAHLIHGDGRAISFRPIFGGATVQLWITGNAAPDLPDNATPAEQAAHEAQLLARLPEGHRYNKATTLITDDDEEPATIILNTLQEHLLPAFQYKPNYVGHQPWKDFFDNALATVTTETDTPQTATATNSTEAEPHAEAQPEPDTPEPATEPQPDTNQPEPEPSTPEPQPEAIEREPQSDPTEAEAAPEPELTEPEPEPQPETTEPGAAADPAPTPKEDGTPEATPTKKASGRSGTAATRRPRKRTPKRRSDTSTS
ncbi:hypothetical protein MUU72_29945 [Streptomyces sp. RS10V-4]|uniref:hypothetical protein n=1 Tax=Streptomyces rhizoryzae TaxID=2932493 RepID=UPI002005F058|nr:hypothetical protein [Streptomyces rhizoryzae]MCK7627269.1 hypothetical protein [Streptomyces rhizoryzae]